MTHIALQLYTVRDELGRDFRGTLGHVARSGFHAVELFDYHNLTAPNLKDMLSDLGLKVAATHVDAERLKKNLEAELDYALELGCEYLVTLDWQATTTQDWYGVASELETIAQRAKSRGLTLAYHNEPYEIKDRVDGQSVMDVLLQYAPTLVAELDIAWVHAGGLEPVSYVKQYHERLSLIHLKDVKAQGANAWQTVELGRGEVDVLGVLEQLKTFNPAWLILEQDDCEGSPFESVTTSLEWLKQHLKEEAR
jgi:sugar phosphate isomerase/epimerase